MCGLFGAIGKNWNLGTIRALALANRDRGTDSIGFFDSSAKLMKKADDPADALQAENVTKWLINSAKGGEKRDSSWFIAGHTRLATRGRVNRQNSHPFRFGNIVGAHNGMVDAPKEYVVDSMYLFDALNKAKGNYQEAWEKIVGYWGITWYNIEEDAFYMQAHRGDLHFATGDDGVIYYSSDKKHLLICIGHAQDVHKIDEGETFKFTIHDGKVTCTPVAKFECKAAEYWSYRYGVSNSRWDDDEYGVYHANYYSPTKRHGKTSKGWTTYDKSGRVLGTGGGQDTYRNAEVTKVSEPRDWDQEWREAWASYCGESEHSVVDECGTVD